MPGGDRRRPARTKSGVRGDKWGTPEMFECTAAWAAVPWGRTILIIGVLVGFNHFATSSKELWEDMQLAYELEAPVPTRSAYAEVPVVGRGFQFACDFGDVMSVSSSFITKYASAIPWLVAAPAAIAAAPSVAVPMLKGAVLTKTAAASILLPLLPAMR